MSFLSVSTCLFIYSWPEIRQIFLQKKKLQFVKCVLPLVASVSWWGKLRCRPGTSWRSVSCSCTIRPPGAKEERCQLHVLHTWYFWWHFQFVLSTNVISSLFIKQSSQTFLPKEVDLDFKCFYFFGWKQKLRCKFNIPNFSQNHDSWVHVIWKTTRRNLCVESNPSNQHVTW